MSIKSHSNDIAFNLSEKYQVNSSECHGMLIKTPKTETGALMTLIWDGCFIAVRLVTTSPTNQESKLNEGKDIVNESDGLISLLFTKRSSSLVLGEAIS